MQDLELAAASCSVGMTTAFVSAFFFSGLPRTPNARIAGKIGGDLTWIFGRPKRCFLANLNQNYNESIILIASTHRTGGGTLGTGIGNAKKYFYLWRTSIIAFGPTTDSTWRHSIIWYMFQQQIFLPLS